MKRLPLAFILFVALAACNRGWTQGDRDKLINTCVEKALAQAQELDPTKLKNYCTCYQQKIEMKFTTMEALAKATPESVSPPAQECLPILTQ